MRKYIVLLSMLAMFVQVEAKKDNTKFDGVVLFENATMNEVGNNLEVNMLIQIKNQAVQSTEAMSITPILVAGDNSKVLPTTLIQGKNRAKSYDRSYKLMGKKKRNAFVKPDYTVRVNSKSLSEVPYNISVPYEMWMDDAKLVIRQELVNSTDARSLVVFAVSDAVQLAPRTPYVVAPFVSYAEPVAEVKQRSKQGSAFLDFVVARSTIDPLYRRNPQELAKIRDAFAEVSNNKDVKINGLFIDGYASPEGKFETNERLSKERANALKEYIVNNYKPNLTQDKIKVESTAEDWDGLKLAVEQSNIARKAEVLAVFDIADLDAREAKLKTIGGGAPYRVMLKDMFPALRRVEYQIDYTVKDYSVAETKSMIGKHNNLLSQKELYDAAQSYDPKSKEYTNIILDVIPKQYPENQTAIVNAAALMIERGERPTAKRYLDKFPDSPQAWNNLGVIHLYAGELDQAQALFERAAKAGVAPAEHNLKEVAKKREDNARMARYTNRK